jgi:penicillin amidase
VSGRAYAPDSDQTIAIEGLAAPASISVDRAGLPHIRAESLDDLWFMQGFNAARDRLWQIDLWRKRGLGLLAQDFGPGFLEQDKAARLFLYRGDMEVEWRSYAEDARDICARFAAGINAYVALAAREPERLPPEFAALGTRPARWAPDDVVRIRSHGLSRQAVSKIVRARMRSAAGAAADDLRRRITPAVEPTRFDDLPLDDLPLDAADALKLATATPTFTPERLAATLAQAGAWRVVNEFSDVMADAAWQGSNNWAVDGARSGTGAPILASDPHRAHSLPSLRYIAHLTAPGFDAIGAGEPAVPGLSLGHNGEAAFGLTIFGADHEDVYVYETHPDDPDLYRYAGGWERMRVVEERIPVKGCDEQVVAMRFTRHGPVTRVEPDRRRAVAIRSVWFEPGSAPYLASLSCMRARTLDEFRAGNARWGAPSINHVYADRAGSIAWMPGGRIPVRRGWNGLLPVPGDGRCEWDGFLPASDYPERVNPASGFVFSANEMNLPDDWRHDLKPIGFDWADRARADRILETLGAGGRHGVAEARALQTDETSLPARRLCALLSSVAGFAGDVAAARDLLAGWDGRESADSAAAALFEVWWAKHLKPALFRHVASEPALAALIAPGDSDAVVAAVAGQAVLAPDARDAMLRETLAAAFGETRARLGADAAQWAWGRLHHGYFPHALASVTPGDAGLPDVGPLPIGGSGSTVKLATFRGADFRVMHGASFRMIVDLADLDRSVCVNAPGQSGDPRSVHYDRLAPLWATSDYAPMPYSSAAVDAATEFVWRLTPA